MISDDQEKRVMETLEMAGFLRHVDVDKKTLLTFLDQHISHEEESGNISYQTNKPSLEQNEVREQLVQYVVNSTSATDTKSETETATEMEGAAKSYRFYVSQNLPSSYLQIVEQWNNKEIAKMDIVSQPSEWLHHFSPFISRSETEITLMLRYVKQRNAFFEQHSTLNADEVINVLGLAKKNARRTVRDLANKHQLILFKHENKLQAPAFQFNAKGQVYPALLAMLPLANEHGIDALELAMWLTCDMPALITASSPQNNVGDLSFEAMLQQGKVANTSAHYSQIKPIEALASGKENLFNVLVQRWLNDEHYSLSLQSSVKQ